MPKTKLLSNDPFEQEYQAKITATSMALAGFYSAAMNAIIEHHASKKPQEDVALLLDNLSVQWATKIVDDISPKKSLL